MGDRHDAHARISASLIRRPSIGRVTGQYPVLGEMRAYCRATHRRASAVSLLSALLGHLLAISGNMVIDSEQRGRQL